MHPLPTEPAHAMARIDVHCAWHGTHVLLMSGDAALIRVAARHLERLYEEDGYPTDVDFTFFDLPPRAHMDVEDYDV